MFDRFENNFHIGEELSIEEYKKYAKLDRSTKPHNISRDERLLLKYCYAMINSLYYMHQTDGTRVIDRPSNEATKAMFDIYVFTVNKQIVDRVRLTNRLTIKFNDLIPSLLGGYDQDVIEFALLQAGYRIKCDTEAFNNIAGIRLQYGKEYALELIKPITMRELADSIEAKIENDAEIDAKMKNNSEIEAE